MSYLHDGLTNKKTGYIVIMTRKESDLHTLGVKWIGHGEKFYFCQIESDREGNTDLPSLYRYVHSLRGYMPTASIDLISFRKTEFLEQERPENFVYTPEIE